MPDSDVHSSYRDHLAAPDDRASQEMRRFVADDVTLNGRPGTRDAVDTGTPVEEWHGMAPTGASSEIVEDAIHRVSDGRSVEMAALHDTADAARQVSAR